MPDPRPTPNQVAAVEKFLEERYPEWVVEGADAWTPDGDDGSFAFGCVHPDNYNGPNDDGEEWTGYVKADGSVQGLF